MVKISIAATAVNYDLLTIENHLTMSMKNFRNYSISDNEFNSIIWVDEKPIWEYSSRVLSFWTGVIYVYWSSSVGRKMQFTSKSLFEFGLVLMMNFLLLTFCNILLLRNWFSAVASLKTKYRFQQNIEKVSFSDLQRAFYVKLCSTKESRGSR